jgi:diaminopimelate epimerase
MIMKFTKMQALGNDFVVFDAVRQPFSLDASQLRHIADRHFGVGCDQILVVDPPPGPEVDFGYRIFNADGGEVEQCGNGARCFVRFVLDKGLAAKREIAVATRSGVIRPRVEDDGRVTVDMGRPRFEPQTIPFVAESRQDEYDLEVAGQSLRIRVVSMGNPHAVRIVDDIDHAPVTSQGPLIEHHPRFPNRVNAGFMQVVDAAHIRVRVYERGAGETLACGTGACAAVVAGRRAGLLGERVRVELRGGFLDIRWRSEEEPVYMTGPAHSVFEGSIDTESL